MIFLRTLFLIIAFTFFQKNLISQSFTDSLNLNGNRISDSSSTLTAFNSKLYDALLNKRSLSVFLLGDSHVRQGGLGKSLSNTLSSFIASDLPFPFRESLDSEIVKKIISLYHENLTADNEKIKPVLLPAAHHKAGLPQKNLNFNQFGVIGASYYYFNTYGYASSFAANLKPDLYIVALGVNDCYYPSFDADAFMTQVKTLVAGIRKHSPDSGILIVLPPDHFRWQFRQPVINENIITLRDSLIPWLIAEKIPWYDFFTVMGGQGSIKTWQRNKFAEGDLIHFTNQGYELWGKLLGTALINNFIFSLIKDEVN